MHATVSFQSHAAPIGPSYPAPGGHTFAGNGVSGADGTAVWNFSNFDVSGLDALYYGQNQVDYGAMGARLNGRAGELVFVGATESTATLTIGLASQVQASPIETYAAMHIDHPVSHPAISILRRVNYDGVVVRPCRGHQARHGQVYSHRGIIINNENDIASSGSLDSRHLHRCGERPNASR